MMDGIDSPIKWGIDLSRICIILVKKVLDFKDELFSQQASYDVNGVSKENTATERDQTS